MLPCLHPEVLANDWLPPVVLGREREVAETVRRLDPPAPCGPVPWIVAVAGPSGSGTSSVARRAAREVADRVRVSAAGPVPRVLAVRTGSIRGSHGVATALLQRLDDGFDGRGFPVPEILAGVLRRLRREGRPVVLLLDDVSVGGPDLGPILRAIGDPDRFLPEGESGLPPLWTILAGVPEGLDTAAASVEGRFPMRPYVAVAPYSEPALRALVIDRLERSLGRPAPVGLVDRIVLRTVEDGGGARRALELVRRELVGGSPGDVRSAGRGNPREIVTVEPRVVHAIDEASRGVAARLGDVRRIEAELAVAEGLPPLPTTTLWRRIVRLEQAGYLRREIRPGGVGGTRSLVKLLTPVDEWVTIPGRRDDAGPIASPPRELDATSGPAVGAGARRESPRPPAPVGSRFRGPGYGGGFP